MKRVPSVKWHEHSKGKEFLTGNEHASRVWTNVRRDPIRPVDHRRNLTLARRSREDAVQQRSRDAVLRTDDEDHVCFVVLPRFVDVGDGDRVGLEPDRREGYQRVLAGAPAPWKAASDRYTEAGTTDVLHESVQGALLCNRGTRSKDVVEEDVFPEATEPVEAPDSPDAPDVDVGISGLDVDVGCDQECSVWEGILRSVRDVWTRRVDPHDE